MSPDAPKPGLAWPDHDTGPTPPPEYKGRPREEDLKTRKPMALWDRVKILVLLLGAWGVMLWAVIIVNEDRGVTLATAARFTARTQAWLLILAGLELLRQLHYLISEHSSPYHFFWTKKVFPGFDRRLGRMNDWNRFRLSRALKWLFIFAVVDIVVARALGLHPVEAIFQLPVLAFQALPFILQIVFILAIAILQFVAIFWFLSRGGVDVYMPDDVKTRFDDVWGQDSVLEKVKENMVFLEDPESIEEKGGYVPGGILLWGPPGTGKTLMAEAVAGETGKPFVFVEPGAFINMFFGVGLLKVKSLFRKLRKLAVRYGGVIAFFDEADALGNRGAISGTGPWGAMTPDPSPWATDPSCNGLSYMSNATAGLLLQAGLQSSGGDARGPRRDGIIFGGMGGGGMGTLQALLTEMSGLKKPRGFWNRIVRRTLGLRPKPPPKYRILIMMASNMPQALDEALLRPGRIDRIYRVGYPSKEGRKRTYIGYLDKVSHSLTDEEIDRLATITPYATGASIKDLVNEALINSIRAGRDTIEWVDIVKAKLLKSLGPPEDVEYIQRERHAVAIHEACHAVAAYRVRRHLAIDIATIEKGSTYLGMVSSIPLEEQFTRWRSEYEADLIVSLASLAGERIFFDGDSSSGVSADLHGATSVSMFMEGYWGMGSTIGSHAATKPLMGAGGVLSQDGTDRNMLETELGRRVEERLSKLYDAAYELVAENRSAILGIAHALETHKTLTGDDVEAIIEGREGPLVDGRPYHTPEFAASAERYHAEAVAAHKGHTNVMVALPTFDDRAAEKPVAFEGEEKR